MNQIGIWYKRLKARIRVEFLMRKRTPASVIRNLMEHHDSKAITANKYTRDFGTGQKYTKKDNEKRSRSLLAKLGSARYQIFLVNGSYIESQGTSRNRKVGKHIIFVVDVNNTGKLRADLYSARS